MQKDPIDRLLAEWERARPDLDFSAMGVAARVHRASALLKRRASRTLAEVGLKLGELDVLSALRRAGPPHVLTAGELTSRVMMSPGGMTNRLDRLEAAGLVKRHVDEDDRRSRRVALTRKGERAIDRAIERHVASLSQGLAGVDPRAAHRLLRRIGEE